jgi:hypothetical protein
MNTTLLSLGFLPLSQPYNVAPWSYSGTENVGSIPALVVDWILVELRSGTAGSTKFGTRAAFLKNDGTVLDLDGSAGVTFTTAFATGYHTSHYVVIRHRNHLGIMSATTAAFPDNYIFTSAQTQAYGTSPMIAIGTLFGMITGDYNASGDFNATDDLFVKNARRDGLTGYRAQDMDLTGDMSATDALRVKQGRQNGYVTRIPN